MEVRLANGLRLIVEPVPGTSWVGVIAIHGAGSLDDPPGRSQMAHLVEHLRITAAAGEHGPGERWAELQAIGSANGETQPTTTHYDLLVPRERLRDALETEAERLGSLRITADDIAREAPRTAAEVELVGGRPDPMLHKFALMAATQGWVHGRDHAALLTAPAEVTVAEAEAFLARHASPADVELLVIGDVDPTEVRRLADETVGAVPGDAARAPRPPRTVDWAAQPPMRRMTWDAPRAVVIVAHAPAAELAEDPFERLVTTAVTAAVPGILQTDPPETLHPALASFFAWPPGDLPVLALAVVREGHDPEAAAAELAARLDRLAAEGLPPIMAFAVTRGGSLPGPPPRGDALRLQAADLARAWGIDADRARGTVLLNAGLQWRMLARMVGGDPGPLRARLAGLDRAALDARLARALAAERRFVTILEPAAAAAADAGAEGGASGGG